MATATKTAPATTATTKKTTPRKSTAKKSTAKKSTAKKSTAKRSTAKKSTAKKSTTKRAPRRTSAKAAPRRATKSTSKSTAIAKRTADNRTPARVVADLLPEPVGQNAYLKRTLDILDDNAKRQARLRADRAKKLRAVWTDLQADLEVGTREQLEGLLERLQSTRVATEVGKLPTHLTSALDEALGRIGLMRQAAHQKALTAKSSRRR